MSLMQKELVFSIDDMSSTLTESRDLVSPIRPAGRIRTRLIVPSDLVVQRGRVGDPNDRALR
jgi:hypothetical protein